MTSRTLITNARIALDDLDDPRLASNLRTILDNYSAALNRNEALYELIQINPDDLDAMLANNTAVEAENARLRKAFDEALRSLSAGAHVHSAFCSWCGEHWPRLDGETFEVTKQHAHDHAKQCPEHPLRLEVERLKCGIREALSGRPTGVAWPELGELRRMIGDEP